MAEYVYCRCGEIINLEIDVIRSPWTSVCIKCHIPLHPPVREADMQKGCNIYGENEKVGKY